MLVLSIVFLLLSFRARCQCHQVIKVAEVACGVGNVLQNKGGIGAFVRVDRTTFLFVAAHLAAHQVRQTKRSNPRNEIKKNIESGLLCLQ